MDASDQNSSDMIVDGLEGICQFAIQINDKVTEISSRILACEFKISQVSDELLLSKKFTGRINNENSSQLECCLRRMDGFETMIKELKADIDKCKQIMSNDFILLNEEEKSNVDENIEFTWKSNKSLDLPENLILGQQAHVPSSKNEEDPRQAPTIPMSQLIPRRKPSFKLQIVPCIPEFYSIVDTNIGTYDSITTQDELKDLYSRKLALIKGANRIKLNPEMELED